MDRLIRLAVCKLRARVSGCLCLVMGGRLPGLGTEEKCISTLSPGTDICRQGQWAAGSPSLSCPASNNGSQQPPPPHITHITRHTRVTRNTIQNIRENWYKYQKKSVCGDPLLPLLQTQRWHLFLLAAHLRQNFFQTFFVVKTQPAGGVWVPLQVLLTHVSIFREGCLFLSLSSLAQPIFYGSFLQVLMKIVSTYSSHIYSKDSGFIHWG